MGGSKEVLVLSDTRESLHADREALVRWANLMM